MLFPSGFQANASVPAALLEASDVTASDALNHASMIDGLRLSRARREIVPHLERPTIDPERRTWWFCESVFSMDGDGPALADLESHLAAGGCLYLDEAHAVGLYANGRGRAGSMNRKPTIVVAPLGKALGCAGAFVAGSRTVCEWLRGHARGFVFTTGVSPALLPHIDRALDRVTGPLGDARRRALWANVDAFRRALELPTPDLRSPIVPIVVGDNGRALALSTALLERGWHVQAIRPPTVPDGGARLRITLTALHERAAVEGLAAALRELLG